MNGHLTQGDAVDRVQPDIKHTRSQLLKFLEEQQPTSEGRAAPAAARAPHALHATGNTDTTRLDWLDLAGTAASSWWHEHPARAGALLAQSVTEEYTRRKPLQAVTIAAVTGAAIVLFRPWRLMSATALALRLLRASNFTGMATSVLGSAAQSIQKERK